MGFVVFANEIRSLLTEAHGSCLITEHGRLPVCLDITRATEPHCFHAHLLMFPGVPAIEDSARPYFAKIELARNLIEALHLARRHREYYLLSPDPGRFLVMTRPGRIIRQFSRFLVAQTLGRPELANWRRFSDRERALSSAIVLRRKLQEQK
jgi:hypothetical protein